MIVAVPAVTPVTTPPALTVAMAVLLLLHGQPGVASFSVVVAPWHINVVPVIATGSGVTVTTAYALQPAGVVYVIVDVPVATPVTTPEARPTVATDTVLLLHVPPAVASVSVVVFPMHIDNVPSIGEVGFTVMVTVPVTELTLHASNTVSVYVVVTLGVTVAGTPVTGPGVQV